MGNKDSIFFPCYDQDLPSGRNGIENYGFPSAGPVKAMRKKCSIATSETISIVPIQNCSNRSSVTEFIVNRSESTGEGMLKTPEHTKYNLYSVPSSPGRSQVFESTDYFSRNSRKEGVNLVEKVRSRSLANTPKTSIGPEYKNDELSSRQLYEIIKQKAMNGTSSNESRKLKSNVNITKRKVMNFDPLKLERCKKNNYVHK
ncbi:hypothetical protein SteCoe_24439 [Stentor coeruleus]|uniref:Uncharacterized protein n=1 Tax=Stentor coeruleus TaxID=5963 RepID=A0A1R2BHI7_9CILI|nr:hypothetical protein SteCoe_24439 [Stentor coeruleus]